MMNDLAKLHEWKGNTDYKSGFHRGLALYSRHRGVKSINEKMYIDSYTDTTLHTRSFIEGFIAGTKQARLEKLLLK